MKTTAPRKPRLSTRQEALAQNSSTRAAKRKVDAHAVRTARALSCPVRKGGEAWNLGKATSDRFHFNSLALQVWFAQLHQHATNQYAERAKGKEGPSQTGQAWRTFRELFEPLTPIESVRLFENLLRFANYDAHAPARAFFLAYAPLAFEHDASGEYIGPGVWTRKAGSKGAALRVRRTLERWCDWLEALAHFHARELCHPEPSHRDLDKAIIFLWPLLKRHNWSHGQFLDLLRSLVRCPATYPCESEDQLAAYCKAALGLEKPSLPNARKDKVIAGQAVAERLFKFLPLFR